MPEDLVKPDAVLPPPPPALAEPERCVLSAVFQGANERQILKAATNLMKSWGYPNARLVPAGPCVPASGVMVVGDRHRDVKMKIDCFVTGEPIVEPEED